MKPMLGVNQSILVTIGAATLLVAQPVSAQFSIADLGTLGGTFSAPRAINEAGQVVGVSQTATDESRAFLWDNGTMINLGTLPNGSISSEAVAINGRGQIVGRVVTVSRQSRAFLWDNGNMIDLGTLGGCCTFAQAINGRGQVVGTSATSS